MATQFEPDFAGSELARRLSQRDIGLLSQERVEQLKYQAEEARIKFYRYTGAGLALAFVALLLVDIQYFYRNTGSLISFIGWGGLLVVGLMGVLCLLMVTGRMIAQWATVDYVRYRRRIFRLPIPRRVKQAAAAIEAEFKGAAAVRVMYLGLDPFLVVYFGGQVVTVVYWHRRKVVTA